MKKAWVKFFGAFMLFLFSVLLSVLLIPISLVIEFLLIAFNRKPIEIVQRYTMYFNKLTLAVDQFGNVAIGGLMNMALKKDDGYPFGDEDDTISKALHYNYIQNKLTRLGTGLYFLIEWLDPGHFEGIENW